VQRLESQVARHAAAVAAMEPRCPVCGEKPLVEDQLPDDDMWTLHSEAAMNEQDQHIMAGCEKCHLYFTLNEAIAAGHAVALEEVTLCESS
jgi:rRNA maturation protein Nop10